MNKTGRTVKAVKNVSYTYLSSFINLPLNFIVRSIFIYYLGKELLGVNGLFTGLLQVLSLTELGVAGAVSFAMYKPVAEGDTQKIVTLLSVYKKIYRKIALVITLFGLMLLQFLKFFIKNGESIGLYNIAAYYLIFLFNTVITYFVSYKYCYLNACQKNYVCTNITTVFHAVTLLIQIAVLYIFKNMYAYLISETIMLILQNLFTTFLLNGKYPLLCQKPENDLPEKELNGIKRNVFALVYQKIGLIGISQTDYVIISSFIDIGSAGIASNYLLIVNYISKLLTAVFGNTVTLLGNFAVTEEKDKQNDMFGVYTFLNFWVYGFSSIALFTLLTPLIQLWIGNAWILNFKTVLMICLNFYLFGQYLGFINFKAAYGVFSDDKHIAPLAALLNILLSIIFVRTMGIAGVFLATTLSSLFLLISSPVIAYKRITGQSVMKYFALLLKYFAVTMFTGTITYFVSFFVLSKLSLLSFVLMMFITALLPNILWCVLFCKKEEFKYLLQVIKNYLKK